MMLAFISTAKELNAVFVCLVPTETQGEDLQVRDFRTQFARWSFFRYSADH